MYSDYDLVEGIFDKSNHNEEKMGKLIDEIEMLLAHYVLIEDYFRINVAKILMSLAKDRIGQKQTTYYMSPRKTGKSRAIIYVHKLCLDNNINSAFIYPSYWPKHYYDSMGFLYNVPNVMTVNEIKSKDKYDLIFIDEPDMLKQDDLLSLSDINTKYGSIIGIGTPARLMTNDLFEGQYR